jgi:hypothetical protein
MSRTPRDETMHRCPWGRVSVTLKWWRFHTMSILDATYLTHMYMYVCVYIYIGACVCIVCTHTHTYIYIFSNEIGSVTVDPLLRPRSFSFHLQTPSAVWHKLWPLPPQARSSSHPSWGWYNGVPLLDWHITIRHGFTIYKYICMCIYIGCPPTTTFF